MKKLLCLLVPIAVSAGAAVMACDTEDATTVDVDNDYPVLPNGGDPATELTVYKVWWVTSYLPDAVAPGSEGQSERTVPNTDYAYAVLAAGWDPSSSDPPTKLYAMRSNTTLHAARGDTLHVHVSDATFTGNCAAGKPLAQSDADFVTQRIFPGEFAGTYDAATCTFTPTPDGGTTDAGDDASLDAGTEAGLDGGPDAD